MLCPYCGNEWPLNVGNILFTCPFCQNKMNPFKRWTELSPEELLTGVIDSYGEGIINNNSLLKEHISILFEHDIDTKSMLLFSIDNMVHQKLYALKGNEYYQNEVNEKKESFYCNKCFEDNVIDELFTIWINALAIEESIKLEKYTDENSGLQGFQDYKGNIIAPAEYDWVYDFSEGFAAVCKNGKYGFINRACDQIIPLKYKWAGSFSEGVAKVCYDKQWGFINNQGVEIIDFNYDNASDFDEGLARVSRNSKYGFVDIAGNEVIPLVYDDAKVYSERLAAVCKNSKWGFINKHGSAVTEFKYDKVDSLNEGLAWVVYKHKQGYINAVGVEVISPVYDQVGRFYFEGKRDGVNENIEVVINDRHGVVRTNDKLIFPCIYDFIAYLYWDDVFMADVNDKKIVLSDDGKQIIPGAFDEIDVLSKDFIRVELGQKIGFYNGGGNMVTPMIYEPYGWYGDEKHAIVKKDDKIGVINSDGVITVPFKYDAIRGMRDYLIAANKNGKWGYVNRTGGELIPFKFDEALNFINGLAIVRIKNKWGLINHQGMEVLPIQFDNLERNRSWDYVGKIKDFHTHIDIYGNVIGLYKWNTSGTRLESKNQQIEDLLFHTNAEIIPNKELHFAYDNIRTAIVNNKRVIVGDCKYDQFGEFENNQAVVKIGNKATRVRKYGGELYPFKYQFIGLFNDGHAPVFDGLWGCVRSLYEQYETIPLMYQRMREFSEGLAAAMLNNKWGYINFYGQTIIPFEYDNAESFVEGIVRVIKDGQEYWINKNIDVGIKIPDDYYHIITKGSYLEFDNLNDLVYLPDSVLFYNKNYSRLKCSTSEKKRPNEVIEFLRENKDCNFFLADLYIKLKEKYRNKKVTFNDYIFLDDMPKVGLKMKVDTRIEVNFENIRYSKKFRQLNETITIDDYPFLRFFWYRGSFSVYYENKLMIEINSKWNSLLVDKYLNIIEALENKVKIK